MIHPGPKFIERRKMPIEEPSEKYLIKPAKSRCANYSENFIESILAKHSDIADIPFGTQEETNISDDDEMTALELGDDSTIATIEQTQETLMQGLEENNEDGNDVEIMGATSNNRKYVGCTSQTGWYTVGMPKVKELFTLFEHGGDDRASEFLDLVEEFISDTQKRLQCKGLSRDSDVIRQKEGKLVERGEKRRIVSAKSPTSQKHKTHGTQHYGAYKRTKNK